MVEAPRVSGGLVSGVTLVSGAALGEALCDQPWAKRCLWSALGGATLDTVRTLIKAIRLFALDTRVPVECSGRRGAQIF